MGYFSREDLNRKYAINNTELSKSKTKKIKIDENEWENYKKKYVKTIKNQEPKNWEHDDDDER